MSYCVPRRHFDNYDICIEPIPPLVPLIIAAITALSDNPRPSGATKLVNRPGWRVRVGNYRVLYRIDDKNKTVTIASISKRAAAPRSSGKY